MKPLSRIAIVLFDNDEYGRGILRGLREFCRRHDHWLITRLYPNSQVPSKLAGWRADGCIAHLREAAVARGLRRLSIPTVNISDAMLNAGGVPLVSTDNIAVGHAAAAHLLDRGLRHFAFFGTSGRAYSNHRLDGFRHVLADAGHTCLVHSEPGADEDGSETNASRQRRLEAWLRSLPKPIGIFAFNDRAAARLSNLCRSLNLQVPHDVALIGVGNCPIVCELRHPPLSSVALPLERIGYLAAVLLDELMLGKAPPQHPLRLPPVSVVARRSTDMAAVADPNVGTAMQFIRDHAHQGITVADVVSVVAVYRRRLEQQFRALIGHSLLEEIHHARVQRTKQLLADTEMSAASISQECGFSSPVHLNRVFVHQTGLTPLAYRKRFSMPQAPRVRLTSESAEEPHAVRL